MENSKQLKVWLDKSVSCALCNIIYSNDMHFLMVSEPFNAEVIIFENDTPRYIRKTIEFYGQFL